MVQALIEIGKTVGEILVTLVTRPAVAARCRGRRVAAARPRLLREIFTEVGERRPRPDQGQSRRPRSRPAQALIEFTQFIATAAADVVKEVLDGPAGRRASCSST